MSGAGPDPARARRRGQRLRGARVDHRRRRCARSAPTVHIGHSPTHLDDADTSSTPPRSTRSTRSSSRPAASGMPVLRRAAALAAALEDRRCVAIAGTHGKTSTTSLLTVAAQACGVDPSFAIGGNLYETGKNAHLGTGELAIVEADESDGSFLLTAPVRRGGHQRRGRPPGEPRRPRGDLPRLRAVRRPHRPDGLLLVCADDPGARADRRVRARRRPAGAAPTAERADADVGSSDIDVRPMTASSSPSPASAAAPRTRPGRLR